MSDARAGLQDRTFAPATAVTASAYPPQRRDRAGPWPRVEAGRLLSYAAEGAL